MASNSEIGHAKNIANAKKLNDLTAGFGGSYNPTNPLLIQGTMVGQQAAADALQQAVNAQYGIYYVLREDRPEWLEPLGIKWK